MSDPFARIIADSISPEGIRITTLHLRYWRGIHAELMTHRAFSRNARSSRAVPVARMLDEIKTDPFVPRHWGKNQKGMQATEECDEQISMFGMDDIEGWTHAMFTREAAWLEARDRAVEVAEGFMEAGYHKQIVNRLIEPFMWIDTLVTATDWANFLALRDHKDAEPHIRDLAVLVRTALRESEPQKLTHGQWHLPYVSEDELKQWGVDSFFNLNAYEIGLQVSAARCARISYAPFDGNGSVEAEIERYKKLVENWPVHASPVEHQACPDSWLSNHNLGRGTWANPEQHRNFRGWRQYRAMIPNETVFG